MTSIQTSIRPRTWLLLALIMALGAALRLADLTAAPVGGHGDVAWKGINALDWIDNGVFPYYVRELYAPEPVIVISTALLLPFTGVSFLAGRLVTVIWGMLLLLFLFQAAYWLLADHPRDRRELAGLLAAAAGAFSLHAIYLSRLGMRAAIFPALCALLTWLAAWAWHRGGWGRWALAGAVLALMQYTYIPGRLFPLVLALWFAHVYLTQRDQWRARWRGWLVLVGAAVVLSLPNIYTFVTTPEAFTARADTGTATTGGWIWEHQAEAAAQGGLLVVLLQKIGLQLLAFGIYWHGPYSLMNSPMLTPIFFLGFLVAVVQAAAYPRRMALWWPLLAIPVMFFTDLISGAVVELHGLRQTGVLPFACLLAGAGLAAVVGWLAPMWQQATSKRALAALCAALLVAPTLMGMYRYLGEFIPAQYADPDNYWRTEQADVDISRYLIAQPDRTWLLPYDEYNRANIAFFTAAVYRQRRSALDVTGTLRIINPPDEITIVTSSDPYRIRHDGRESIWDQRLWVLLHQEWVFYLPPLLPEQVRMIRDILDHDEPERLLDRSMTEIARLYRVQTPPGLFQSRPALTHIVNEAAFALPGAEPEALLAGYDLPSTNLQPGELIYITLYWQTLRDQLAEDYEIFVQIWNDAGEAVASAHDFPNGGIYRSRIWRRYETTITHHWLRLPDNLPPGAYTLAAGLYRLLHNEPLVVSGRSASPDHSAAIARDLRVVPDDVPLLDIPTAGKDLRFGDMLRIDGADITLADAPVAWGADWQAQPGDRIRLALRWDVLAQPAVDYSLFVHLTAADDAPPVAQADVALGGGLGLPAGVWYPGDAWVDTVTLSLPDDLPAGEYTLWLGVYYYADGARLTPLVDNLAQPGDRLYVARVLVEG
jgi:hypothetical protein